MRWLVRGLVVLVTFVGVGITTTHLLVAHAVARGSPEYSVRLGGAVGGLFVGGVSAVLVAFGLLLARRPGPPRED